MASRIPISHRARWGRSAHLLLWCSSALLVLALPLPAKDSRSALQDTVEWGRMVLLWHCLLDHSSSVIYDPERFKAAAPDLDKVDAGIAALVSRKLLSQDAGDRLRGLFQARYRYLQDRCYPASAASEADSREAARRASHWVMELQFNLLRQQSRQGPVGRELRDAIHTNLARELTFQQRLADLEQEQARRREALAKKEEQKEPVDWTRFESESTERWLSLYNAYQNRALREDRTASRLVPYLVDLTTAQPPDAAADQPPSGL